MVKAVHHGLGISILPYELVKNDIESGFVATIPVSDANLTRNFWIAYHKDKFLSGSLREIIKELRQKQYSCTETEE